MSHEGAGKRRKQNEQRYLAEYQRTDFKDSAAIAKLSQLYRDLFGTTGGWPIKREPERRSRKPE